MQDTPPPQMPLRQGLYDPRNEHDSCGIGFVVDTKGGRSHRIVEQGFEILLNLRHRGAVGADPLVGDGSGILIQKPDRFFQAVAPECGIALPEEPDYAVGSVFLPRNGKARAACEALVEHFIDAEGQICLGWRDVPVDNASFAESSLAPSEPCVRQVFIGRGDATSAGDDFERKIFVIRKQIENAAAAEAIAGDEIFYIPSMSSRTIVYKGMLLSEQLVGYYRDLHDERVETAMALVHQRFSTNTFPSWPLAHPYRMICHNGEINTVRGNFNWMAARRQALHSNLFGEDLDKLWPMMLPGQSDTACFDNALELLVNGGYSLAHAMMLLIPEAWGDNPFIGETRRAFCEYSAAMMEPWDGPAAVAFTDGRQIGATLDRNGLRPARYLVTTDGLVVMSSEVGVLDIPPERIAQQWRLQPGKMLLIDLERQSIIDDEQLKTELAQSMPFQEWLDATQYRLEDLPEAPAGAEDMSDSAAGSTDSRADGVPAGHNLPLLDRQQAFGYTREDLDFFLQPMGAAGDDPVSSMGTDTPLSVLSDRPKLLYTYFKQLFAQVTNPPIDPIREELVMSLVSMVGPRPNLLDFGAGSSHHRLEVAHPILTNADMRKIQGVAALVDNAFRTRSIDICWPAAEGAAGIDTAIERICREASAAVAGNFNIILLSDRTMGPDRIAMPALLACAAVHHHLIREGDRTEVGLVVETGEAREVHHFCVLAGYGAEAINPYLAFETLDGLFDAGEFPESTTREEIHKNYIKAVGKGILKVMSKMGISTYQSYCGAQIFDAVGLSSELVGSHFTGTATTVEGVGLEEIAAETALRHDLAFGDAPTLRTMLDVGGEYAWRTRGERHYWSPDSVALLQHAVRSNGRETYQRYAEEVNDQSHRLMTLRGLFKFCDTDTPVPIEEVEPAAKIVKRFATGAMSFGSISREAHTTLALGMNRIGGRSNTGEGGEETDRFVPLANGDSMRSAIKQVASGRFGVTTEYLVNSDDIQIKMAQGAKPGEGGQLPGHKVDENIARVRHSTPGVGLISPPPHHDIYSIEDLAQLIHDLKNVNSRARISVKLVSEVGVGTVAAGVAKAKADHVTISGFEGGTGASPITSLTHAGSPWEIGLSETHQTLVMNNLRTRIAVQVDGGLRTGRDVVVGALLGADEFGFSTAPLIAIGCIMMRKCHLNTCPVGIATQDPELRQRFTGTPEHVVNFFFMLAEEVRELMAQLGFRRFDEMIGRTDMLDMRQANDHWKADGVDLSRLLFRPEVTPGTVVHQCEEQDHGLDVALDHELIRQAQPALENGERVSIEMAVRNGNRTFGAMLSGEVALRHGHIGLPEDSIVIKATGTGGQSFGAWLARGVTIELEGVTNDYLGKGLAGGRIAVYPPRQSPYNPAENIAVGNTALYGAIAGECYVSGVAGERFCVRNSGAWVVVEGVGDHGCEYMTGGCVAVLGATGRNFAAGMSGGIAYVLDEDELFERRCNTAMVDLETIESHTAPAGGNRTGEDGNGAWLGDMMQHDEARLRRMVERHLRYTGSVRARHILENWDTMLAKFVKVMPVDYRRALNEQTARPAMEQAVEAGPQDADAPVRGTAHG